MVDGKRFKNYADYPSGGLGHIPLRTARRQLLQHRLHLPGRQSSDGALADAAASLGIGLDHDLGFPAYFGEVPAAGPRPRPPPT